MALDRKVEGLLALKPDIAVISECAEPSVRALGALKILAKLQSSRGPKSARQTALRLSRQLPQAFKAFHNRARRRQLLERLPDASEAGNLVEMLALVESPVERQRDAIGFNAALREYDNIQRTLAGLRADGKTRPQRAAQLGASLAAATAMFLAWATGLALVVVMT